MSQHLGRIKILRLLFGHQAMPWLASFSLLGLRLMMGYAFMAHGGFKIANPFAWMGADSSVPGAIQFLAALSEYGGGLALILGLLTRLASLGIASTMVGAVIMHLHVFHHPITDNGGGHSAELPLIYFFVALVLANVGAGRISLDAWINDRVLKQTDTV